ncbi:MAG: hypothetical protein IT314_17050 [Anaerolineales bacterium]|nr:hypothetical protein [Anaerolineales bacterium]
MKVRELVTQLSTMPSEADVVIKGYEGGVDDVVEIRLVMIRRDANSEWYYGMHEIDDTNGAQAVFLAGPNRESGDGS